jgi:GTP cyclohydrolase IA
MQELIHKLLVRIGEDPTREGLVKTPERVAEVWKFLSSGYSMKLEEVVNDAIFEAPDHHMVIVKDIEFFSLCEHHLLPFYGRCHIGYIPTRKVVGVSKLARVTDMFARRLQLQERLTSQIAAALQEVLEPDGVGVVMEAKHLCMMMRGVEKQNSSMVTSAVLGSFRTRPSTRAEFLNLVGRPG